VYTPFAPSTDLVNWSLTPPIPRGIISASEPKVAKGVLMSQTITTIYEQGVLRPLEPLALVEHSQVKIQVLEVTSPPNEADETHRVEEALITAGLIKPLNPPPDLFHISAARRQELARLYAVGGPLSELVIAERAGR
jgi:predicted DNA-binding antitoxin AbrB/MazE fold protein